MICEKQPTLFVSFPLRKLQLIIKEVTRDISDNYVSTFVLVNNVWFLKKLKYSRNYFFSLSTILVCHFRRFLFIIEVQIIDILCQLILYFQINNSHWHNLVVGGSNRKIICYISTVNAFIISFKNTRDIAVNYVSNLVIYKYFWLVWKQIIIWLAEIICKFFTNHGSSFRRLLFFNKGEIVYGSSYCILKLLGVTDTI